MQRIRLKRSSLLIAGLVVIIANFAGCAVGEGSPSEGQEELRVVSERLDSNGFRIAVFRDEASATITVQRTRERGPEFTRDPELDSPYDVEVILRNRSGVPFMTSSAHGILSDPDMGELDDAVSTTTQQAQIEDMILITDAADELLADSSIGDAFRWEIQTIKQMANFGIMHADDGVGDNVSPSESLTTENGVGVVQQALSGTTYKHQVYITKGPCSICGDTGEHSAVVVFSFRESDGQYQGYRQSNNHGREATHPSMTTAYNCPKWFYGRSNQFPNFQPYVASDTYWIGPNNGGGCHTSYGVTSGHHVCNDDSRAQYWNVKLNYGGTWTFCQDSTLAWWAPFCEESW